MIDTNLIIFIVVVVIIVILILLIIFLPNDNTDVNKDNFVESEFSTLENSGGLGATTCGNIYNYLYKANGTLQPNNGNASINWNNILTNNTSSITSLSVSNKVLNDTISDIQGTSGLSFYTPSGSGGKFTVSENVPTIIKLSSVDEGYYLGDNKNNLKKYRELQLIGQIPPNMDKENLLFLASPQTGMNTGTITSLQINSELLVLMNDYVKKNNNSNSKHSQLDYREYYLRLCLNGIDLYYIYV